MYFFTLVDQNNIRSWERYSIISLKYYFDSDLPLSIRELKCIVTRLLSVMQSTTEGGPINDAIPTIYKSYTRIFIEHFETWVFHRFKVVIRVGIALFPKNNRGSIRSRGLFNPILGASHQTRIKKIYMRFCFLMTSSKINFFEGQQ